MPQWWGAVLAVSLALTVCVWFPGSSRSAKVVTPNGIYYGNTTLPNVDQFLSIPYAQPPVGDLRFAAPVPYNGSASHVVDATNYGPACPQNPIYAAKTPNGMSEDCLTLSVIRPAGSSSSLLPVVVFIFGGAHIGGQILWYHGANLVKHSISVSRPIIYVGMNYRLGGLGYLYSSLLAEEGALNLALKDQRLALEWIQHNIRFFGGDPEKVILTGQSSGSFDTWMQMRGQEVFKDETAPLFRGAIMMSGGPASLALRAHPPSDGDAFFDATLAAVGCADAKNKMACLRAVPLATFLPIWYNSSSPLKLGLNRYIQESTDFAVDGKWITTPYFWTEDVSPVALIVGDTLNEGSLYVLSAGNASNRTYLTEVVAIDLNTTDMSLAGPVVDTYYHHTAEQNGRSNETASTVPDSYFIGEAALGDLVQNIPRRAMSAKHSTIAPTWGYRFSQQPPVGALAESFYGGYAASFTTNVVKQLGVLHAVDLAYVFGDVTGASGATAGDLVVEELLMSIWIAFAYDLDPNTHGLIGTPYWATYDKHNARILNIQQQQNHSTSMQADDLRLDSYDAYNEALKQAGRPPLPDTKI